MTRGGGASAFADVGGGAMLHRTYRSSRMSCTSSMFSRHQRRIKRVLRNLSIARVLCRSSRSREVAGGGATAAAPDEGVAISTFPINSSAAASATRTAISSRRERVLSSASAAFGSLDMAMTRASYFRVISDMGDDAFEIMLVSSSSSSSSLRVNGASAFGVVSSCTASKAAVVPPRFAGDAPLVVNCLQARALARAKTSDAS
mmetsp:Transcript_4920/g.11162  ORF Transcript_4920/g.11162 Transcript_4920/m.11162 type:complete len:203 (-) Transcript_4920:363-971(-)